MKGSPYQPAVGVWRSTPQHTLLWAVHGVLAQIERSIPETKSRTRWQAKLERLIGNPVKSYPWSTLYDTFGVSKDDSPPDREVPTKITDAWSTITTTISTDLWMEAGAERADRLHLPFDPAALKQAMDGTMHMVSSIPDTLHDRLREIMAQAYEQRSGQFGFAREIRSEFADVSKFKAEQIATTEWARAASQATIIGYKAQGIEQKIWLTAGDERVCPTCEDNAAMGAVGIDGDFLSGDTAPPAHPGCRCDVAAA